MSDMSRPKSARWRGPQNIVPPVVVLVAALAALEIYLRAADVPAYLWPRPSAVGRCMIHEAGQIFSALGWTTLAALGGFVASLVLGVTIAVALSAWPLLRRAIYPYTIFFQTVPIVAIAPVLVLKLGFGLWPVIVCAWIVSVFPVIATMLAGLLSTDPALVDLLRLYGAGPIASLWKLRIPWAMPSLFSGLRVAAGLAVIGTVVAEFLVGQMVGKVGLGVVIVDGIHRGRLDLAFAAVLMASMLGLALFVLVNVSSWLCLRRWRA